MELKLDNLLLHNFGIFKGEHELDLRNKDVIGIIAEYHNDKKRSNRSGKTLLIEAIKYLLIGVTRSDKEMDMIHYGEKVMFVTGVFSDNDNRQYTVTRGRDHKNKGVLTLDWIEKGRETQAAITELFGVSKEDFELTNFFKQGEINGFMDKTPAEKTAFLMKWLDNEHWKDKENRAKKDRDRVKNELRDVESSLKAIDNIVQVDEGVQIVIDSLEEDNKELTKAGTEIAVKIKKIEKAIQKTTLQQELAKKEIIRLRAVIDKNIENINDYSNYQQQITNYDRQAIKLEKTLHSLKSKHKEASRNVVELELEGKAIKKDIKALGRANGKCPILGTACNLIKNDPKKMENKLQKVMSKLVDAKLEQGKHEENNETLEQINLLEHKSDKTASLLQAVNVLNEHEIAGLEAEIDVQAKLLKTTFKKVLAKKDTLEDKLMDIDADISSNRKEMGGLEEKLRASKEARKLSEKLVKDVSKLRKELETRNYVVQMFGKNGIPADEIDNSFTELQDTINGLLSSFDDGLSISFQADKEINKWEPICSCGFTFYKNYKKGECEECNAPRLKQRRDEIQINVIENGNETAFKMDSGGGKLIIAFCVRIALTLLKKQQNKCKLNILFLDEIDAPLDEHLARQILNSITKVLTKRLGYDQIFIVSHKDEIKNSAPHILKVIRNGTESTVKFTE